MKSLQAKIGELVLNKDLHIVDVTETWWNGENQRDMIYPGSKLCRKDREE